MDSDQHPQDDPIEALGPFILVGLIQVVKWIIKAIGNYWPHLVAGLFLIAVVVLISRLVRRRQRRNRRESPRLQVERPSGPPRPPLLRRRVRRRGRVRRDPDPVLLPEPLLELHRGVCLVCRGPLEEDVVYCRRCGTPQHRECFRYAGVCSMYACRSRRYVRKARGSREAVLAVH